LPKIETSIHGSRVTLDILDFDVDERDEVLGELFDDIVPIIGKILECEALWQNLSESDRSVLVRPHMAMSMKVSGRLAAALQEAENHKLIVSGRASISDHGFPEFVDGASQDV
jgi:hypothetical protein